VRFADVYSLDDKQMMEVKTGRPSANTFILDQIAADKSIVTAKLVQGANPSVDKPTHLTMIQSAGARREHRACRSTNARFSKGGSLLPVDEVSWDFMPNAAGVTTASKKLLEALHTAGIPIVVFIDGNTPCGAAPIVGCRVPVEDLPPGAGA